MSFSFRLGPYRGLWSATGGDAPSGYAGALLNVSITDGHVRPRKGYRNLAGKPTALVSVHGMSRVSGYDVSTNKLEWVTIEDRGAGIKPYSVDVSTWARTEITNGGTPVSLDAGDWSGFPFDGNSYWINPESANSLYKHEVGTITSWAALQDATYTGPVNDPAFALYLNNPFLRPYDGTDTIAVSGSGVSSPTTAIDSDGNIVVSGSAGNNSQDSADSVTTVTFATAQDFSLVDYQGFLATGGLVYIRFKLGVKLEVKIAGTWSTPPQQVFLNDDRTKTGVVMRMKGYAGANAVQAVRMTVRAEPQPHKSGIAYTLSAYVLGGSYLGATATGDRPWDATYKKADITYAVRYRNVAAGTTTGIKQKTFASTRFGTFLLDSTLEGSLLGDRVSLEIGPMTTGGFTDDPAGTSYKIEYLRLDQNGAWHILGTQPNTTGQSWRDVLEEVALQALPAATPAVTGYVPSDPLPVFSTGQLTNGFAFHGCVVWLYNQGKANIRFSRVGEAESLANPSDDTEDLARGADFTMADDFADAPLGGVQAGDAAIILGKEGCYALAGTAPYQMTPPRKIPGSAGGAGRFAFCRYVDLNGNPGMAWYDTSGENLWFASAGLVYSGDSQARPIELSETIRGTLRQFLFAEQREAIPGLALSDARMDFDAATGSLWLVLGQRAAVLRAPSLIDGKQQWELMEFALGSGTGDVSVCSDPFGPTSGIDQARGTVTWTNPNDVIAGAGVAATSPYLPGASSHWLKGLTFVPGVLLPAEATLTTLTLRVRHRATSGGTAPTPVKLAAVDAYNGATLNLSSVGGIVPSTWTNVDFDLDVATMATDIAGVNSGAISARVAYDAIPADSHTFDAGNWSISVSPGGQLADGTYSVSLDVTFAVAVSWIGVGAAPSYAPVSLTGSATLTARDGWDAAMGTGSVNNGLGASSSGSFTSDTDMVAATAGLIVNVPLVAGVGTHLIHMTASGMPPAGYSAIRAAASLFAVMGTPSPTTVEVESVELIACYTVPAAEGARTLAYLAFGPDRSLIWLRSSGHLDAVEWCPTCKSYIGGSNRDGGLVMPDGYWESARLPGALRRLTRVEIERDDFVEMSVTGFTERITAGATSTAPAGQRWTRFDLSQQGGTHRLRINVPESLAGVSTIDMVFQGTAGPGR